MTKEELIKIIQKLPDGINVRLFDWRQNLYNDCGDGCSVGIYSKFHISMLGKEDIQKGTKPFAVISFDNEDYNDHGQKAE